MQLDVIRDLYAAVAADLVDNLDQVPGRYRVLHGGIGRLGGGIGADERECNEDGQATLLKERCGAAATGAVHWRGSPWEHRVLEYSTRGYNHLNGKRIRWGK